MTRTARTETIPALPNRFPYNELLLLGKLSAKTRNWRWGHTGLTLLYTSTSTDPWVARAYGLDPRAFPRMVLVGMGYLLPVRPNTPAEIKQIEREFANGGGYRHPTIGAGIYRYEFRDLMRFAEPIPFRPPQGAITTFRVPASLVATAVAVKLHSYLAAGLTPGEILAKVQSRAY